MAVYNTASDAANTAVRAFLTKIGGNYLGTTFNTSSSRGSKIWETIKCRIFENRCAYCDKKENKLQIEHLIMFNKDEFGLHHPGNIVPVCSNCNKRAKDENNTYKTWEEHLYMICNNNNQLDQYVIRRDKINKHTKEGEFKYPKLNQEENNALRIITNNLYESVKNEFEKAVNLFEELDKAFSKK
ncbi:MAG: HNH endonuclease [Chitinophagales bacterium]|nr:HNH endonuclease [Chitinophagales bacterium]